MITKQAIRRGVTILCNGEKLNKEEVIDLGKNWTEKEENFFRKMLKQGGLFVFQGNNFDIKAPENIYNSKGEIEATLQEHEEE